ncbi:MAG: UTP--glucose-1-phosphate uridylyltransferase [Lachnospiraceae bacterium]|nr:UTP--glucose-1-phosphate uridylyltransferase [Lachnospiraceae bacterium]
MNLEQAKAKLEKYGQMQVLRYYDELDDAQKEALLAQIDATDMSIQENCAHQEELGKRGVITPLDCMEIPEIEANRDEFDRIGLDAIKAGKVAALLLAGGMGTRLGSDDPKGMYNIGKTRDLYIFECLFNNLREVTDRAGAFVHIYIMTSEKNNDATVRFLKEKNFFGYPESYVHFFMQDMAAATDYNGKIYLEEKGRMATSPNGNGGWFISLVNAGLLDNVHANGIEWFNVFAVDNVLQRIADPVFVGATIAKNCTVGAKVVRKAAPDEKVGVICLEDGKPSIVEYYDLTEDLMNAKNEKGDPAYNFGVILNYLFSTAQLEKILNGALPLHIVEKKIPCLDENGNLVKPESPNGYKYENLVLDMIHQCDSCLPFEVVREKEFAPIKNKTGVDSVESAQALLEKNGVIL